MSEMDVKRATELVEEETWSTDLDSLSRKILALMVENPFISNREIADKTGLSVQAVCARVKKKMFVDAKLSLEGTNDEKLMAAQAAMLHRLKAWIDEGKLRALPACELVAKLTAAKAAIETAKRTPGMSTMINITSPSEAIKVLEADPCRSPKPLVIPENP